MAAGWGQDLWWPFQGLSFCLLNNSECGKRPGLFTEGWLTDRGHSKGSVRSLGKKRPSRAPVREGQRDRREERSVATACIPVSPTHPSIYPPIYHLSVCPSTTIHPSIHPSFFPSIHSPVHLLIHPPSHSSMHPLMHLFIHSSIRHPTIHLSIHTHVHLSVHSFLHHPPICSSSHLSTHLLMYSSTGPSTCLSVHPFIHSTSTCTPVHPSSPPARAAPHPGTGLSFQSLEMT